MILKFKHRTPSLDPEKILGNVAECTKTFERALNAARDKKIEGTAVTAAYIGREVRINGTKLDSVATEVKETYGVVSDMNIGVQQLTMGIGHIMTVTERHAANSERYYENLAYEFQVEKAKIAEQ